MTHNQLLLLSLLGILPLGFVVVVSLADEVPRFFTQCTLWGVSGGSITISSGGPCSGGIQATSETTLGVAFRLGLIQGGILVGIVLGVIGVLRHKPKILVICSAVLLAESIPLVFDGLFVLTVLPAVYFLWIAKGYFALTSVASSA